MSIRTIVPACVGLLALALVPPAAAPGGIILTVSPSSQNVTPGGTGYALDFGMTTSDALDLGGFNVTLTVPSASGIIFTGCDSSVANYVFAGNSLGLAFTNPAGSNTGDIADSPDSPSNQHLLAGTYGLGRMFFSVAPDAPLGNVTVTLDAATSFTQGLSPFETYDFTPTGGSSVATITVAAVPEPSSLLLGVAFMATGGVVWLGRRLKG